MKIFYSNMGSAKGLEEYYPRLIDVLISYYGLRVLDKPIYCRDLFLDSGAFSAHKSGVSIDPGAYAEFVLKNKEDLFVYASLDVIGDAEATWNNQLLLERRGLCPLPTFHFGEPIKWLDFYIDRYDYLAIGALVSQRVRKELLLFLDGVFARILQKRPTLRVHGFGIQDEDILRRYPWFSVDASSVHMQARYGGVRTPWGWLKINPEVNFQDTRWHTPLQIEGVQEWVAGLQLPFSFEQARQRTTEGTLMRCAISLQWFEDQFGDHYQHRDFVGTGSVSGFGL